MVHIFHSQRALIASSRRGLQVDSFCLCHRGTWLLVTSHFSPWTIFLFAHAFVQEIVRPPILGQALFSELGTQLNKSDSRCCWHLHLVGETDEQHINLRLLVIRALKKIKQARGSNRIHGQGRPLQGCWGRDLEGLKRAFPWGWHLSRQRAEPASQPTVRTVPGGHPGATDREGSSGANPG